MYNKKSLKHFVYLYKMPNMNDRGTSWKFRFQNYEKALSQLNEAVDKPELSDLEKEGLIQRFEYTFELAWKTLKDYLLHKGIAVRFPRDTIKEAYTYGIINNGEAWLDMLAKRNLMSHTYDESNAEIACNFIAESYIHELQALYKTLKAEQ